MTDSGSPRATRVVPLLACAVALALALRLTFALVYWVDKPLTVDQTEYLMLADNLASGAGLVYDEGERRLMRSPGYPLLLAAVFSLGGRTEAVKVVQSALGTLSVLLVAALAYRVSGTRAALTAAFTTAIYPPLVWMPAYMLSESLYMVLTWTVALMLWSNLDAVRVGGLSRRGRSLNWRFLAAGAVGGLAVLTRPEMLIFEGLVILVLAAARRWVAAVALVLGTVVVVAPWTTYTSMTSGELVLVSSRGGPNFWLGNSALAPGDGGAGATPDLKREYNAIRRANPELSPSELEGLYYTEALTFIRENPLDWLALEARKLFYFWVPIGPSYSSHSVLYWVGHAASYLLLLPFALAGFLRLRRRSQQPVVLWALAGATVATSLIFFPLPRYRIPIFDAVLIVCASSLASDES